MADLFDVAGTSVGGDGTLKARFANGLETRIKMLQNAGHDKIDLHRLPKQMTKAEAGHWLLKHIYKDANSPEHTAVTSKINSIDNKASREAKRSAVTGEAKAAKPAAEKKTATPKAKTTKTKTPKTTTAPAEAPAELATATA